MSTKVVSIPMRRRVTSNWVKVPPYSARLEMMWSPASQTVRIASSWADIPEAQARPPRPPSSAAMRSSKAALVGLPMRV